MAATDLAVDDEVGCCCCCSTFSRFADASLFIFFSSLSLLSCPEGAGDEEEAEETLDSLGLDSLTDVVVLLFDDDDEDASPEDVEEVVVVVASVLLLVLLLDVGPLEKTLRNFFIIQ